MAGQLLLSISASTNGWAAFQQDPAAPYLVSVEAEHYSNRARLGAHDWVSVQNFTGYSGQSAMQALPQDGYVVEYGDNITGLSPRMDFQVQFTRTGTYYVWIRGWSPSGSSDSIHVGLDGVVVSTAAKLVLKPNGSWIWANKTTSGTVATLNIASTGLHTINVWLRESGSVVDKVVLAGSSKYVPSGLGPAESVNGEPTPTAAGLVHYWQLNEASGPSYSDSASGKNASCIHCPTASAGLIRNGQTFNGIADALQVSANGSYNWPATGRFSIEFWLKTASCSGRKAVLGRRDSATQLRWWAGCEDGKATFYLRDKNASGTTLSLRGRNIANGRWHHIVAIRDSIANENRLYVDGVQDAVLAVSYGSGFNSATAPLTLGWLDDTSPGEDYHFAGLIDEVAIHGRVLSDSLIRRHYTDGSVGLRRGYVGCSGSPVRIMPLGDSITNRPGYRRVLYPNLVRAGHTVDFVGSRSDNNVAYDPNHEGHSGYTPADIAANLLRGRGWLNLNPPEVVLLHIGTNQLDIAGVEDILDDIDARNPATTVVLARIINHAHPVAEVTTFNKAVNTMAQTRIARGDKILLVDHEKALSYPVDFKLPDGTYDELHPNDSGFAKMAKVWFQGLGNFLPVCTPASPWVTSTPPTKVKVGVLYSYQVEAAANPLPTFSLQAAPAGMTIHPDTGLIEWTPKARGQQPVTLRVQNSRGSTTQNFTINVN